MRRLVLAIVLLVCAARAAAADSRWWRIGGEGAVVVATEVPLKPLTDVLAGATIGVAAGLLVPRFNERNPEPRAPGVVLLSGVW